MIKKSLVQAYNELNAAVKKIIKELPVNWNEVISDGIIKFQKAEELT